MDDRQPNHDDPAGEAHAEIVRRNARILREDQRRFAVILDERNWAHDRIREQLDLDADTLTRLLAADGLIRCTECAFARHRDCSRVTSTGYDMVACECGCRSTDIRC